MVKAPSYLYAFSDDHSVALGTEIMVKKKSTLREKAKRSKTVTV